MQEIDAGGAVDGGIRIGRGFESEPIELLCEQTQATRVRRPLRSLAAPGVTNGTRRAGVGTGRLCQCGEHSGEQHVRGRVEAETRRAGRE